MKHPAKKPTRRHGPARLALLSVLAAALHAPADAAEPAAPRFSMRAHTLAPEPRSDGKRFAVSATLAPKAVPKDVSWDTRFQMRATVEPKALASISCGSSIFSDGFEN